MRLLVLAGALFFLARPAIAQQDSTHKATPLADTSHASPKLRVYLDCDQCDFDYLRTEITFVDYVRNRQDAAVHILVTTQETGSGGREYTLNFIGQRQFASMSDTLRYASPPAVSPDELRRSLGRVIKLGLVRYVARLGDLSRLDVTYKADSTKGGAQAAAAKKDPWNYWVFRTTANGYGSGEKADNFVSLNGSVNANRVTELWKTTLTLFGNYGQSRFELGDGTNFNTYSHSYGLSDLIVKSIGARWAVGQQASWTSSTFLNQKHAVRIAPAVEYDFFPYSQSTRRMWTLRYAPGINWFRYQDTTIYDRISEVRADQTLTTSLDLKQPWGSISSSIEGAVYLHDTSKRHIVFFNSLDLRLFKGFSLFMFGQASLIHDQLYLPRGDLSDAERLLRLRQLETSYSYFLNFGISYSFGSIFNNVVNPRFGGSSGGFTIIN
ncbi:MAG TPA: hypothetical protein VGD02_02525 [Gemmatimonadaceae bacterium]|jgi:hypothetical protein